MEIKTTGEPWLGPLFDGKLGQASADTGSELSLD